jgi:hypothetical protein
LTAVSVCVMAATPVLAENWVYLGATTNKNGVMYYDAETIERIGNQVTVWVKLDFSRVKSAPYLETKSRYRVDCKEWTSFLLDGIAYYRGGKIASFSWEPYEREEVVPPDSIYEDMIKEVCEATEY